MTKSSRRTLTLALVSPATSAALLLPLTLLLLATILTSSVTLAHQSQPLSTAAVASRASAVEFQRWLEFKEFQEFQAWKKLKARSERRATVDFYDDNDGEADAGGIIGAAAAAEMKRSRASVGVNDEPPPIDQPARMARYIVNQAGWTSVATVSSRKDTESYPFVNLISFSDGPLGNGTGIPYLYLTPLDFTAQDVFKDNRATLMMTLAQGRYCETKNYDPMDPRCARVVFSGKIKAVKESNPDYPIAKNAVFSRHPWLAHMPKDHHFFFAKLKIGTIAVLDTFGGPKYVTLQDYLHPPAVNTFY